MFNNILSTRFWFMESNYLKRFLEDVQGRSYSDVIEIEARAAEFNKTTSIPKPYKIDNGGIASIKMRGPLMKRVSPIIAFFFGIRSMEMIGNEFKMALDDKDVAGIMLDIDSPGGSVDGTAQLADIVYSGRGRKPIMSYADGAMTSGAYWIGSGADQIILADQTTRTGSIGVVGIHAEYSEQARQKGIGLHVFSAGKFKKIGNEFEKLSKDDIKYINSQFEYLHNIFMKGVQKNLGRTLSEDAKEGMVYIGEQGISAGLAHAIMTRGQAMARLQSIIGSRSNTTYKTAKAKDITMYANYNLLDFVKTITQIDSLGELRRAEEDIHSEIKRREAKASNWIEKRDARVLKDNIAKIILQQSMMISAQPKVEKRQKELDLGRSVARGLMPNRCK